MVSGFPLPASAAALHKQPIKVSQIEAIQEMAGEGEGASKAN